MKTSPYLSALVATLAGSCVAASNTTPEAALLASGHGKYWPLHRMLPPDFKFSVRRRDVSYWDVGAQQWAIAAGKYTFSVGASSRDLKGEAMLDL